MTELKVEQLEVRYGDLVGVAAISLKVEAGQIVALLGSNGAGKTTTLNAIAGLVRPTRGRIEWRGERISGQPAYAIVRKGLALSPEGWRLFVTQTVEQNLRLGATALADRSRIDALFERVYELFPRLAERRRQMAGTLSGGERQMLALGRALMSEPQLLMLDEPSLGLAPAVVDALYETLHRLHQQGLTLLLAEQSIPLALGIANYAYVLQTGNIALEGPAADLERNEQVQEIYLGIRYAPLFSACGRGQGRGSIDRDAVMTMAAHASSAFARRPISPPVSPAAFSHSALVLDGEGRVDAAAWARSQRAAARASAEGPAWLAQALAASPRDWAASLPGSAASLRSSPAASPRASLRVLLQALLQALLRVLPQVLLRGPAALRPYLAASAQY